MVAVRSHSGSKRSRQRVTMEAIKAKLLDLAASGAERPKTIVTVNLPCGSGKTVKGVLFQKLGRSFRGYTRPTDPSYDPEFTGQITDLCPGWFSTKKGAKKEILKLAKSGKAKPLSFCLSAHLDDKEFADKIRKTRPDWFVN